MKTLYLECTMGAAGDMLMAALLELLPERAVFLDAMRNARIPGVTVRAVPATRCGIVGTQLLVEVNGAREEAGKPPAHAQSCDEHGEHAHMHSHEMPGEHEHMHSHDVSCEHEHTHSHDEHAHGHSIAQIEELIEGLTLPWVVKQHAKAVYRLIAEAEGHCHGKPVPDIHFHEVGTMDAVADIAGVCLLMHLLAPARVLASPVHVGAGQVKCAHGLLPIPAPATAYLLRGVPIYGGAVMGELCTPTGAALLRHFVQEFGAMPVMTVEQTGYGMGSRTFAAANCVRAHWGETMGETMGEQAQIVELSCNLDDISPEHLTFAREILEQAHALDVYTTAVGMKKGRAGVLLTCLCKLEQADELAALMLRHTTTLGVRKAVFDRYTLSRRQRICTTRFGDIRIKIAMGDGFVREKPEYEDVARAARAHGVSIDAILAEL